MIKNVNAVMVSVLVVDVNRENLATVIAIVLAANRNAVALNRLLSSS